MESGLELSPVIFCRFISLLILLDTDQYTTRIQSCRVGFYRHDRRHPPDLSASHIETSAMPRALYLTVNDGTILEAKVIMRAGSAYGIDLLSQTTDGDRSVMDFEHPGISLRNIVHSGDIDVFILCH
jgi:hypothetical protein